MKFPNDFSECKCKCMICFWVAVEVSRPLTHSHITHGHASMILRTSQAGSPGWVRTVRGMNYSSSLRCEESHLSVIDSSFMPWKVRASVNRDKLLIRWGKRSIDRQFLLEIVLFSLQLLSKVNALNINIFL